MDPDKFIHEHVSNVGRPLLPSIRPLIRMDTHGELDPVGSCVLLENPRGKYLVSAAHVFDNFINQPLLVGTASKWYQLVGDFRITRIEPGARREDDPYDYGFFSVSPGDAAELDGCRFLTTEELALGERPIFDPPYRSKYLALGWPRNKLHLRRKERVTEPQNVAFTGVIAPAELYVKYHRNPSQHILIEYDPKQVSNRGGDALPPSFDGMSGGGIFTVPGLQRLGDKSPPRLAGITIEVWRQRDLYVGTRIDVIHEALDDSA